MEKKYSFALVSISLSIFAICIFSNTVVYNRFAIAASSPANEIATGPEPEGATDSPPSRISMARVQSSAQKIVQEEVLQEKTGNATPPPQPMPQGSGEARKGKKVVVVKTSEKSEPKQSYGPSAIQSYDSLSSGSTSSSKSPKGKSAGKEDSFD